ncbi:MAG TPA: FAD-dependent oxidoreductase, partial [Paracoccaceae bacterium]
MPRPPGCGRMCGTFWGPRAASFWAGHETGRREHHGGPAMSRADFAIVGGGIVGLATALRLQELHPRARIALLEKESAVAQHQSGHNSGV